MGDGWDIEDYGDREPWDDSESTNEDMGDIDGFLSDGTAHTDSGETG